MPLDYVFAFQNEEIDVLQSAMKANPRDARAPYYLGNLLYDWQPEEATKMWQASAALDPRFSVVHRNLATAYMHQKSGSDINAAVAEMEKAVSLEPKYALHFTELDELYEQAGTPIEKRLPLFESNATTVAKRDDAQNRAVALKVAAGKYEEAIRMMTERTFAVAEGANLNVGEQWTNAHFLRGQEYVKAKRFKEAIADFEAAVTLPSNLPMGRGGAERNAEFAYSTGVAYEGMGDQAKAAEFFKQGVAPRPGFGARRGASAEGAPPVTWGSSAVGAGMRAGAGSGAQAYYEALCYQKLGQADRARQLFQSLVESGQKALQQPQQSAAGPLRGFGRPQSQRARLADAHYTTGLGYLGLNDREKAKAELSEAVKTSPDLLGARTALAALM
jgi:tetratricopeptide (TPR) repeat protein